MSRAEIARFRQQLLTLSERLRGHYARIHQETLYLRSGDVPSDPPEQRSASQADGDSGEQAVNLNMLANEARLLQQADAALARIDQGTFGLCQECAEPIARQRLRILPYTAHCTSCAQALERSSTRRTR